ncbi:MAG: hypothetical protein WBK20_10460 [Spirochaetota bacterium]
MRIAVILSLYVYLVIVLQIQAIALQSISVEYRQDALDYSMKKEDYLRASATIATDTTEVNATVVQSHGAKQATWSFATEGDYAAIAGGYYFIHNATGLLLGKASVYNPDPYFIHVQKNDTFISLCKSGNPQYAMYGVVSSLFNARSSSTVKLDAGVSYKECYISSTDAQNGVYPYSIQGLLSHFRREGQYTEPVQIVISFVHATVNPVEYVTLQACYYSTNVYYNNAQMLFNANTQDNYATGAFGGYSLYAHYHDSVISLFSEYAISNVVIRDEDNARNRYSKAYYCGLIVKDKKYKISSSVQKMDKNFFAPFGNTFGGNSPRDIYYYSVSVKPVKKVTCSWIYIDQNNLMPSTYYAEYPHKRINTLRIVYKNKNFSVKSDYRHAQFYKDGEEKASRYQEGIVWGITKNSSIHLKCGLYQGDTVAWYSASGFGIKVGNLQNDFGTVYAHTDGEKMYVAMLPLPQTNIISETIATSSFFLVARLRFSNTFCKLSVRLISQLHPQKQTAGEVEAAAWF